ncbi:hypothetical protein [Plantactinospora sp. KBS50]|uniref:hypothetical protein n=1 Tax=Plantactinospora sp. KBS50 TaxID=2024580 RepID=UPI000BAAC4BC|nr:hypothetical protein [Plantactinospora sp. KBS50]ASW55887.1 hypothetical protein CIK06_19485 [Plantactinospora sp. KBS50]
MDDDDTIVVDSDWLPPAELDRLLVAGGVRETGLRYDPGLSAGSRGIDPTVAIAAISGAVTLLAPFLAKLAERLFAAEPDSTLSLRRKSGGDVVVVRADVPAAEAGELIAAALRAGARNVQIGLADQPG